MTKDLSLLYRDSGQRALIQRAWRAPVYLYEKVLVHDLLITSRCDCEPHKTRSLQSIRSVEAEQERKKNMEQPSYP